MGIAASWAGCAAQVEGLAIVVEPVEVGARSRAGLWGIVEGLAIGDVLGRLGQVEGLAAGDVLGQVEGLDGGD